MNTNTFVSSDEILAEILVTCDDTGLSSGVTKGWYYSRIRDSLKRLGYETFFLKVTVDIKNWFLDHEPKGKRSVWLPENVFNIREIYLWSGECCEMSNARRVHWKSLYNNEGAADGMYTSARAEHMERDEFYGKDSVVTSAVSAGTVSSSVAFANIQNGLLMIESDGASFPHLRLMCNGIPSGNIATKKIVPDQFKDAVHDSLCERFFRSKLVKEPRQYKTAYEATLLALNGDGRNAGSWLKAERFVKSLDTWQRRGLKEYLSRANE